MPLGFTGKAAQPDEGLLVIQGDELAEDVQAEAALGREQDLVIEPDELSRRPGWMVQIRTSITDMLSLPGSTGRSAAADGGEGGHRVVLEEVENDPVAQLRLLDQQPVRGPGDDGQLAPG